MNAAACAVVRFRYLRMYGSGCVANGYVSSAPGSFSLPSPRVTASPNPKVVSSAAANTMSRQSRRRIPRHPRNTQSGALRAASGVARTAALPTSATSATAHGRRGSGIRDSSDTQMAMNHPTFVSVARSPWCDGALTTATPNRTRSASLRTR